MDKSAKELQDYYWKQIDGICYRSLLGYEQLVDVARVGAAASIVGIDATGILHALAARYPQHRDEINSLFSDLGGKPPSG